MAGYGCRRRKPFRIALVTGVTSQSAVAAIETVEDSQTIDRAALPL
jgi:hypothetical protein